VSVIRHRYGNYDILLMSIERKTPRNMTNIIVRRAALSDIGAIVAMRTALQQHLEERDPEVWKFTAEGYASVRNEITTRLNSKACYIGIAETTGGKPAGMVMAEIIRNMGVVPELYGHIHWLYVKEPVRRYGIGKRLVQFTNVFFSAWNVDYVTVGYVINNKEAATFWPGLGFKPRVMHSIMTREQLSRLTDDDTTPATEI
jgi:ribosomal protein S18 acetylase RimI-like enzyme